MKSSYIKMRVFGMLLFSLLWAGGIAPGWAAESDTYKVVVDPPDRLSSATVLGHWDKGSDAQGWQGTGVTGLTVSDGRLAATATAGSPARIFRSGLTAKMDLDFGFNDFLQIRMQLPKGFKQSVLFRFGTTTHGGFADNRVFRLPAADLMDDGAWHVYRLDLGLVVWWRDSLTDLEIRPLGDSTQGGAFAIDYVEVGDTPGDVLGVNTNLNVYRDAGETPADCKNMQSKHAVFWWSPKTIKDNPGFDPAIHGRRALRMIEECYQVYCKALGYLEPFTDGDKKIAGRFKINFTTWYGGFWMGGDRGFTYLNVGPGGLGDEGWGNPVPHEFGHALEGAQPGFLTGGHWESHGNFLRQARNTHYAELLNNKGDVTTGFLEISNVRQDYPRLIYADYRIHQAITDFATSFGLPSDQCARMWTQLPKEQTCYVKLAASLPKGVSMKDFTGFSLRHWPFLDFPSAGDTFKRILWPKPEDKAMFYYVTGSHLIPCADKPGWWRSPFERSPEKYAFMMHELKPQGPTVTVQLQGMDVIGSDEDWRWSLAAMDAEGKVRYSAVQAPGAGASFTMRPGEKQLFLVVVATPGDVSLDLGSFHNKKATDKHPDRLRYPYEVSIQGATPMVRLLDWGTADGRVHPNGGGWVANSATVEAQAYVGPNAKVLGSAKVRGKARIEDYAIAAEDAVVQDSAVLSGFSLARGRAVVKDHAKLRDRAVVQDSVTVQDYALIEGYARVTGRTKVQDDGIARGFSWPFGGSISKTAISDANYSMDFALSDGVQFEHVPWGGWWDAFYCQTQWKPRGLVASYRIEEKEGNVCWDEFGARHSILRGGPRRSQDYAGKSTILGIRISRHSVGGGLPQRVLDSQMKSPVLRLDGKTQYVVLDRGLADFAHGSYALWCKPAGTQAGQTLLFLSGKKDASLKWVARGSRGRTRVSLTNGTAKVELASRTAVPAGAWTHLAVTFDGAKATLYVNGAQEDQKETPLVPDQVLGANDYAQPEAYYVGRDDTGHYFGGDLEDVRFYNVAMTPEEVQGEKERAGACLASFYRGAPRVVDSLTSKTESGIRNGLIRTLEASVKPRSSKKVDYFEPVLDSNDERNGAETGSGFGLKEGKIVVLLDKAGIWETGVPARMGEWQRITVSFNGAQALLAVDGQVKAEKTYQVDEKDVAGKNYRIGWGRNDEGPNFFFDGDIKDLRIWDCFCPREEIGSLGASVAGKPL